jgi:hypothetical protein
MVDVTYEKDITGLVVIDPYNDFISEAADYSDVEMRAALEVNIPNYATAVVTSDDIVQSVS